MTLKSSAQRRGVLLLVVLSMLTLFVLLGTTYVVLASRFRSTSRAFLRLVQDENTAPYAVRERLREAAMQVIRGTNNTRSVVRFHDLLADKYGQSAQENTVTNARLEAGNQILRLELLQSLGNPDTYGSRILTFLGGPAEVRMTSHRIVDFDGPSNAVYILKPRSLGTNAAALTNAPVWLNRREFDGHGFGGPDKYLPNWSLLPASPQGTPNEAYDASDVDNVALAMTRGERLSFVRPEAIDHWIEVFRTAAALPSTDAAFDRVHELLTQYRTTPSPPLLLNHERDILERIRRATLRPFPYDHWPDAEGGTDFAGRPIDVRTLGSPIPDVDNDGDGVPDSVWLDLALPPLTLFDRTLVKPLFAIHCIDLDNRLNLNIHGSSAHLFDVADLPDNALARDPMHRTGEQPGIAVPASRGLSSLLTAGLGFGPADVRIDAVLDSNQVAAVFLGTPGITGIGSGIRRDLGRTVGRYGDEVGSLTNLPRPGRPAENDFRRPGSNRSVWVDRDVPGAYGSRSDLWSRYSLGLDHRGQPVFIDRMPGVPVNDALDSPYELDTTAPRDANPYAKPVGAATAWIDQPFTPGELEAIMRMYDADNAATLPPRALAAMLNGPGDTRDLITTESWHTPALTSAILPGMPALSTENPDPDLAARRKMELNRAFGDGIDNDSNGIVDEPAETDLNLLEAARDTFAKQIAPGDVTRGWWLTRGRPAPKNQPGPDHPGLRARQLMAKDLFQLFRALRPSATPPFDDRSIAQWAVNVVDFMDSDAIMTPFRYDEDAIGAAGVVWGCEQPDLIITETLAFHDRAIADTAHDSHEPSGRTMADGDRDFDQIRIPQGSLFVELHAIRSGDAALLPAELYTGGELDLAKVPRNQTGQPPVWRLALTPLRDCGVANTAAKPGHAKHDPFRRTLAPSQEHVGIETFAPVGESYGGSFGTDSALIDYGGGDPPAATPPITVNRYVWFTSETGGPQNDRGEMPNLPLLPGAEPTVPDYPANAPHKFNTFTRQGGASSLRYGDFLVVGPRPTTVLGSRNHNQAGRYGEPSPQAIELAPTVRVTDFRGDAQPNLANPDSDSRYGDTLPPNAGATRPETKSCWVVTPRPSQWTGPRDFRIGLNVSEPLGDDYFPEPPASMKYDAATGRVACGDVNEGEERDPNFPFPDDPFDQASSSPLLAVPDGASMSSLTNLLAQGTYLNATTVFLERLADPTRPHDPRAEMLEGNARVSNPHWNPYIVVDFMPIDLTVLNGETNQAQRNPEDSARDLPDRPFWFFTRQRGFDAHFLEKGGFSLSKVLFPRRDVSEESSTDSAPLFTTDPLRPANPWDGESKIQPPVTAAINPQPVETDANFAFQLNFVAAPDDPLEVDERVPTHTLGWVNQSYGRRLAEAEVPPAFAGASERPLPWITWNDRPFANEFELLLVPRTSAARLLTDYRSLKPPTVVSDTADSSSLSFGFRHINQAGAEQYLAETSGMRKYSEWQSPPITYWGPVSNNSEGRVVYKFPVAGKARSGRLLATSSLWDWGSTRGASKLEVSKDGVNWIALADSLEPPLWGQGWTYDGELPESVMGSSEIWVRMRFLVQNAPNSSYTVAQFGRSTIAEQNNIFSINIVSGGNASTTGSPARNIVIETDPFGAQTPGWHLIPLTSITDYRDTDDDGPFSRADALGRVFDYVHVRSRFAGTTDVLAPSWNAAANGSDPRAAKFKPPFNSVSRQREPGRVNINTLPPDDRGSKVWGGVLGALPRPSGLPAEAPWREASPRWTQFRNAAVDGQARAFKVISGRGSLVLRGGSTSAAHAMFPYDPQPWQQSGAAVSNAIHPASNPDNAWFRFEPLIRASANTTARSEVYAIWVTMGLFEIESTDGTPMGTGAVAAGSLVERYPDKYRLVREYGSDAGQVRRHRAFFIYDRSRSVGYREGEDANVTDGILVESYFD
jgi:hypothetical protein